MSCFRDHGNLPPEDSRFSTLGVSEERNQATICTHGLRGYSSYSYISVARRDHTDLFSCLWTTFGQPCLSPYLPFYIGITAVPEAMRTTTAAKLFEELRQAMEYDPEYRDEITHHWKIFDINTMEQASIVEGEAATLADKGNAAEARKRLTDFVAKRCDEALVVAEQVVENVKECNPYPVE
jgi:dipeptidase